MNQLSVEEAVTRARQKIGLPDSVQDRAWLTRRLDREGESYYLVLFGENHATVGVACVNAGSGEVETYARLPGTEPHLNIGSDRAIELAGGDDKARAEMVWKPSRASRSPLYPLWEIDKGEEKVFVDQGGNIWHNLEPAGPGG
jgi:hypothetical protein